MLNVPARATPREHAAPGEENSNTFTPQSTARSHIHRGEGQGYSTYARASDGAGIAAEMLLTLPRPILLRVHALFVDPQSLSRSMATSTALRSIALEASALRRADLSQGTESCVVRCENTVNGEQFPATPYAAACFSTDSRLSSAVIRGCSCADAQCGTLACSCASSSAYDAHGRLISFEVPGIVECSERCRCDALCCRNRVVSRGLRVPLVVFKTRDRGWGVRSEWPLERGEYVCEYAGAIISSEEATARQAQGGHNYVMSLREHLASGQVFVTCIDPTDKGNVGRYLNHSCDPNLAIVLVRAGSFVPRAAFFCTRPVPRGEELTFFYGDSASTHASSKPTPPEELQNKSNAASRRICRCGTKRCMGFLPFDA